MINRKIAVSVALALGTFAGASYAASPFEGAYVGAQLGYSVYDNKLTFSDPIGSTTLDGASGHGMEGGLYGGWGAIVAPTYYGGLEAEYNWSDAEHTTDITGGGVSDSIEFKDKDNYGISARLGWLPSNNVMLYTRLGWQRVSIDYSDNAGLSSKQDYDGFRLGLGTEVALANNWLARVDYNHTWYGKATIEPGLESELNNDVFRIGVAYKF